MLENYFKTAWRSLIRNKVYSLLNVLGLATGMAVALLIGLWVFDQYSYDRFLPNFQQAYQVRFNYDNNGDIQTKSEVCLPSAEGQHTVEKNCGSSWLLPLLPNLRMQKR